MKSEDQKKLSKKEKKQMKKAQKRTAEVRLDPETSMQKTFELSSDEELEFQEEGQETDVDKNLIAFPGAPSASKPEPKKKEKEKSC